MIKEQLKTLDIIIVASVFGLLILGLLAIYSTSQSLLQSGTDLNFFVAQLRWIFIGLAIMLTIVYLPNRYIFNLAYVIYGLSIILLIVVLFWGSAGYGATRWLRLGSFGFQPSEFAKLATIVAVARFLSNEYHNINQIKTFFIACAIILLPFALILRQPDLGTALVFAVITLPLFYWAGLAPRNLLLILVPVCVMIASFNYYTFFAVMILLAVYLVLIKPSVLTGLFHFVLNIGVGLITPILWNHLEDYQRERIKIFLNPEADPLGGGYQIIQSKVAIGSGGLIGKGFLQGSQTQLRFLPEQHTDFIYAVIGEEFGFMGVIIGLILFALFLFRAVHIANISKSRFNSLVAIGTATIICFHMFVNIGMTVGLFPVTGLPLPFISYGGSALLSNLIMVGLLLNFYRHRYKY